MINERTAMTPEKWERAKNIFDAAVSLPPEARHEVVQRLCGGDSQLESEVKNLIAADKEAGSFLQAPAVQALPAFSATETPVSFAAGQIVAGRFEIRRFLNRGGMGEVYDAWDTELQQGVALKTIRSELASAPSVISRFKREVSQTRQISHPNVCRVYDLFCHQSQNAAPVWFLTMQLLDGETLLDCICRKGSFPTATALPLIKQMVAGMSAAHKLGIVHRDFKSGNVILVKDEEGREKAIITDFGLALSVDRDSTSAEPGGVGTPEYMAPEQWQSGQVNFAADQYALGIVICEMVTGARPIVRSSDRSNSFQVELPPDQHLDFRWERAIRRCLRLRPEERYGDVSQVLADLDPQRRKKVRLWTAAGAAALSVAVLGAYLVVASQPDAELVNPVPLTPSTDLSTSPSLSSNGKVVAYESDQDQPGNMDVYVQPLPTGKAVRITRDSAEDGEPDISPDGKKVVYQSERNGGGIYLASTSGGPEQLLVSGGRNPRFSPDGHSIAYWVGDSDESVASGRLFWMSLDSDTGKPLRLASDFQDARFPAWSSDGQHILFSGCRSDEKPLAGCSEWWVTSLDGSTVQNTGALEVLRRSEITPMVGMGRWYNDTLFISGKQEMSMAVWKLDIPLNRLHVVGRPRRLTARDDRDYVSSSALANGTIAFTQLSQALHIWKVSNVHTTQPATLVKLTQASTSDICPSLSNNGRWLVFLRGIPSKRDILIRDTISEKETVLSNPQRDKSSPIIDDSGQTVVFEAKDSGVSSIFMINDRGAVQKLCSECSSPTGWFGNRVIYHSGVPSRLMIIDAQPNAVPKVLLAKDQLSLSQGTWSPANNYLLFTKSASNIEKQVFAVSALLDTSTSMGSKWIPITSSSVWSDKPRWSPDGKTIYYLSKSDGYLCLWAQEFDPIKGATTGSPFEVMHFHNPRVSPARVWLKSLSIAVSDNEIYLNLGETTAGVWIATLKTNFLTEWLHHISMSITM